MKLDDADNNGSAHVALRPQAQYGTLPQDEDAAGE